MGNQSSTLAWGIGAVIFAILALLAADASLRPLSFSDTPLMILGASFILTAAMLAIVSVGPRMRLSLQLMAIYFAIYLLLPGYNHSSINRFPFYNFSYPLGVLTIAAAMVAMFLLTVLGSYAIAARATPEPTARAAAEGVHVRENTVLAVVLTATSVVSIIVFLSAIPLSLAFAPRSVEETTGLATSGAGLLVTLPRTLTFLAVVYGVLAAVHGRRRSFGLLVLAANLPIFLVVNFPLALPRSQVFGDLLLFSMLLFNFRRPVARAVLSVAFTFGALVAMPVLDHFTRQRRTFAELDPQLMLSTYFGTGDFDGFQSINNAVVYVERFGVEWGRQIVSAFLFFVPRAVWPGKALPTGSITAESAGYTFSNVSQPLPSEFYVDLGWTGVIAGAAILGALFLRLDRWFDRAWNVDVRTRLAAGWLMGFGLPVYRGTLLGVLAPFLVLAFGLWVIARLGTVRVRYVSAGTQPAV